MFASILIANRGEIACRVIRTAKKLGIGTVAVYSDADAGALHVELADEAVRLGPAPAAESYLCIERVLEAARRCGAEAVHPGYGFLSENADFAEACDAAGLVFIGPPASAIRAMGLKDAAKTLMEEAGVPVVPGYHGQSQEPARLAEEAERIGFPVLIKAVAGGGGKGIRRVDARGDFTAALEGAQREAQSSFSDRRVLVEKYIERPRHIEIQVFADAHGNVVHLFERDCSLQRRHQKVVEEAPAPGMTGEVRRAMGQAAVTAAKAIGYRGAGTVEFIVDGTGELRADGFWFMEMNTRLQVEHPVTEAVTGLDLVAWQIEVAAGRPLPKTQSQVAIAGHAFEARLYAEDPANGFMPATGRLAHLSLPRQQPGVRVDTGVRQGDTVTPFYDPMIAKLVVHGPDRATALARLARALNQVEVVGCVTNAGFLAALAAHEGFARGQVDTGLVDRDLPHLLPSQGPPSPVAVATAALHEAGAFAARGTDPWDRLCGFRLWGPARRRVLLSWNGQTRQVDVELRGRIWRIATEDTSLDIEVTSAGLPETVLTVDGHRLGLKVVATDRDVTVFGVGPPARFGRVDALGGAAGGEEAGGELRAPLPGQVAAVNAAAGDRIAHGDVLVVMQSMKMEIPLRAARDGTVAEVRASPGDQVEEGALLISLAEDD